MSYVKEMDKVREMVHLSPIEERASIVPHSYVMSAMSFGWKP